MLYVVSLIGQLILQCRTQTGMHFHSLAKGIIYWTGAFVFNFVALVFYIGKNLKKSAFADGMSSHSISPPIQLVRKYRTICWRSVSGSNGHHFIPHYHRHLPAMNSLYRVSIMVAILQSNKSHQTKTFLCQKLNIKDSLRLKAGWRCTILARLLPFLILLFSGTWTNAKIVFF